jgi:hypothetical protein
MNLLAYMQKRCYFCSQNESGARQGGVPEVMRMAESAELRVLQIARGRNSNPLKTAFPNAPSVRRLQPRIPLFLRGSIPP